MSPPRFRTMPPQHGEHEDLPVEERTLKPPSLVSLPDDVRILLENVVSYQPIRVTEYLHPLQYRAAVLIPLLWNSTTRQLEVQLTQRSSKMRSHAGEVAFPGWCLGSGFRRYIRMLTRGSFSTFSWWSPIDVFLFSSSFSEPFARFAR